MANVQNGAGTFTESRHKFDTPHKRCVAGYLDRGYRAEGFWAAYRTMALCSWLYDGKPIPGAGEIADAIMAAKVEETMLNAAFRVLSREGVSRTRFDRRRATYMRAEGDDIRRGFGMIPDAWIMRSPKPGALEIVAVEVIDSSPLGDKRQLYAELADIDGSNVDTRLEVVAA